MVVNFGEENLSVQTVLGSRLGSGEGLFTTVQDEEGIGFGFVDDGNWFVGIRLLAVDVIVLDEGVRLRVGWFLRSVFRERDTWWEWFEGIRCGWSRCWKTVVGGVAFDGRSKASGGNYGGDGWSDDSIDSQNTGVEFVGIYVLQEESMELGGQDVEGVPIASGSSEVRSELQTFLILGDDLVIVGTRIPQGNGSFREW